MPEGKVIPFGQCRNPVSGGRGRRPDTQVRAKSNEEETFTKLGHAIPHRLQKGVTDPITTCREFTRARDGDVVLPDREHPGDVLHHDRAWLPRSHGIEKLSVKLVARIGRESAVEQAIQLSSSQPGESLAGRSADQDIRRVSVQNLPRTKGCK